ncbi:uncharacterized protein LOC18448145 isoform X3 [Amborella trichopoda]|uniref:uncharacterized protein LOC18448145 isoform X3 n=1 Tax=Amborella trichopoda TaxID=13333 RepID=UPI0009BF14DE|nr:uncharacterized protein LOC18448145 isoform X3 [Amborella trichopoda]|eukprot:XP_020531665.1 uncharacterized protein LOC18448145 isoform X3 [Amborella trichopoda]
MRHNPPFHLLSEEFSFSRICSESSYSLLLHQRPVVSTQASPLLGFPARRPQRKSRSSLRFNWSSNGLVSLSNTWNKRWRLNCSNHPESYDLNNDKSVEDIEIESNSHGLDDSKEEKNQWLRRLRKLLDANHRILQGEPWTVPWTAETILQVMFLWIASFWLVGSWIVPFIAHAAGVNKEALTYRGQALYSLLTDVVEGLTGIVILHRCLARFKPLPAHWFSFTLKGSWHIDVGLGCLLFPFVNCLSQINLKLLPLPNPVSASSVERSIMARDPVAMALYAIVVSVCAPIWEEIIFRGFLLPSLTRYMPVWCSVAMSSLAFAVVHFNLQRLLPLVFLGVVMGAVFVRSRNLLASMLLHSLWNGFVFLDLMK